MNNKVSSTENAAVSVNTPTWKMETAFQKLINIEKVIAHLCQLVLAIFYALGVEKKDVLYDILM